MKGFWNSTSIIPNITLSFILFFISYFGDVLAAPPTTRQHILCRPEQRDALLAFQNELEIGEPNLACSNGQRKTESWTNNSDCCSWEGITCNAESGEVVELDLRCSFLHGRFHANSSLQNLPFLTTLDLSYNNLTGQIPDSIGNLSHLINLRLAGNHFSGRIPSTIGNLTQLTTLDLYFNQFSGRIPYSIEKLSHLTFLGLLENNLVGEIPSSFGNLNQLTRFIVNGNKLSGNFPNVLLNLTGLSDLDISENQFSGALPPNITSLSNLGEFDASDNAFTGAIPSSLFAIPSLTYIVLSDNQLSGTLEFGNTSSPSNLQWLEMGNNNLKGPIPRSISRLVNLQTLDLSHFDTQGRPVDFSIFSHLKSLQFLDLPNLHTTTTIDLDDILSYSKILSQLDLSGNHVSTTNKISVSNPPSQLIQCLHLSGCSITEFPELLRTLHGMEFLDISNNKIEGQVPAWLWTLPNLTYVNLSSNTFIGFQRSTKKQGLSSVRKPSVSYLCGSNNNFTGNIPSIICELHSLNTLDLSRNNFSGFPHCLGNLRNNLIGGLPEDIVESLRALDVGHNQLVGKLPRSLNRLSTLEVLNVGSNRINDTFPFWLGSLKNLQVLVLRSNAFHGQLHQASFPQLHPDLNLRQNNRSGGLREHIFESLRLLDVGHNQLVGKLPRYLNRLSTLEVLNVESNRINDTFPFWLGSLQKLQVLVLRSNAFNGPLYQASFPQLHPDLNLRQNNRSGGLQEHIFESLRSLDVGHNQLVGKLPRSLNRLSTLEVLNVESNRINDTFPFWLGSLQKLQVLVLRSNSFYGPIHQASFPQLRIIDISHNHFDGTLPSDYFVKWSAMSSNEVGSDEMYMGDTYYHDSMVLMNKGVELELVRILKIYTAIDFSANKFEGEIPKSIGLMKELHVLNLGNNAFTGRLPSSMGNLKALESLDVSQNKLSGEIPQELGELSFLAYMNFSHNQLTGLVPGGTQFRTQNCSSFEGNLRLFGPSFDEVCRDIHTPPSHQQYKTPELEDEDEEEVISWIAAAIGFIPGISFGFTIGYILLSYKPKWFMNPFGRNK